MNGLEESFKKENVMLIDKEVAEKLLSPKESKETDVELYQAGVLGGVAKTQVFGIPIGAAGVGLLTVSIWDAIRGLVGGALPAAIPVWLVPAIGAMAVQSRMVKGWMGTDAANAAGLILTADAIQALFNVRGIISRLVGGIKLGQVRPAGDGGTTQSVDQYLKAHGLI